MSITPSPGGIFDEQESRNRLETETFQPGVDPERKIRIMALLVGILFVAATAEGFYSWWLAQTIREMQSGLDSRVVMQEQTVGRIQMHLGGTEKRFAVLEGDMAETRNVLGKAQGDLQMTRKASGDLAQRAQATAEVFNSQLGLLQVEQDRTRGAVGTISYDVVEVREDVSQTRDELASARSDLEEVIGELGVQSEMVAHNQQELETLQLVGERDYYAFDLRKTSKPQRVGPLLLQLKKTDQKRQRYTVDLIADDRKVEKKDKTLFEPVQFYQQGFSQPTEIVVNQIHKDRIAGYVATPKTRDLPLRSALDVR